MSQPQWQPEGTIDAGGKLLEYQCFGPAPNEALTLVLLHEGLGCVELWRDVPSQLAQQTGCGVLVYSRAGYGQSDRAILPRPANYMHIEGTEILPEVLEKLAINKCVLIGHSDGATIAAIHAGSQSDFKARGLILLAPHFYAEEISINAIAAAKVDYEKSGLKDKLSKYHKDVDCAFYGWNDVWLSEEFRHWNVSEVIDYLRVPVLGIQGRQDEYGTLKQLEEIEQRCYSPFEKLIVEDCGHSPHLQHTDQTLPAMAQFINRLVAMEALN